MRVTRFILVVIVSLLIAVVGIPGIAEAQTEVCSPGVFVSTTIGPGESFVGSSFFLNGHSGLGCGVNVIYFNSFGTLCTMYQRASENIVDLMLTNYRETTGAIKTEGYLLNLFRATPGCT